MSRYCLRIVSIFFALCSAVTYIYAQDIVLGVLEDVPGTYVGDPNSWHVRATFHKTQSGWQAFPSRCPDQSCLKTIVVQYPAEISWTFGLDGKILGKIAAQTPKDFKFYGHIGLQNITSGSVRSRQEIDRVWWFYRYSSLSTFGCELTAVLQRSRFMEASTEIPRSLCTPA